MSVLLPVHTSSDDENQEIEPQLFAPLVNEAMIVFVALIPKFSPTSVTKDPLEWAMFCPCTNVTAGPSKEKPEL